MLLQLCVRVGGWEGYTHVKLQVARRRGGPFLARGSTACTGSWMTLLLSQLPILPSGLSSHLNVHRGIRDVIPLLLIPTKPNAPKQHSKLSPAPGNEWTNHSKENIPYALKSMQLLFNVRPKGRPLPHTSTVGAREKSMQGGLICRPIDRTNSWALHPFLCQLSMRRKHILTGPPHQILHFWRHIQLPYAIPVMLGILVLCLTHRI